jgi:hypothetical protein
MFLNFPYKNATNTWIVFVCTSFSVVTSSRNVQENRSMHHAQHTCQAGCFPSPFEVKDWIPQKTSLNPSLGCQIKIQALWENNFHTLGNERRGTRIKDQRLLFFCEIVDHGDANIIAQWRWFPCTANRLALSPWKTHFTKNNDIFSVGIESGRRPITRKCSPRDTHAE